MYDVGPGASDSGDPEVPSGDWASEWRLLWHKEVPPDTVAHRITFNIEADLAAVTKEWPSKKNKTYGRTIRVHVSSARPSMTASLVDRDAEGVDISCLWWRDKMDCFVPCADVTKLVEPLLCLDNPSKDVKARIRRAMDAYKPPVVSDSEDQELFRLILSLGVPPTLKMRKTLKVKH